MKSACLLNKERADPAIIICLTTAAYEGFQTFSTARYCPISQIIINTL